MTIMAAPGRLGIASQLAFQGGADDLVRKDRERVLAEAIWKEEPMERVRPEDGDRCFRVRQRCGFRLHYDLVMEERSGNGLYVLTGAKSKKIEFVPSPTNVFGEHTIHGADHTEECRTAPEPGLTVGCDACRQIQVLEAHMKAGRQPEILDYNTLLVEREARHEAELEAEILAKPGLLKKVVEQAQRRLGINLSAGFGGVLNKPEPKDGGAQQGAA